jgi:glycine cleavage system transcriptional repressor
MSRSAHVVTCIGPDRPGLVGGLAAVVAGTGGNILDSRMAILGGEFAVIMLVQVADETAGDLDAALQAHADESGLHLFMRPTEAGARPGDGRAYRIRADTLDHPGIVQEVARFFADRDINITALETTAWAAAHTGTPMFSLEMDVSVPTSVSARALREAFETFCGDTDLDATLESVGPRR